MECHDDKIVTEAEVPKLSAYEQENKPENISTGIKILSAYEQENKPENVSTGIKFVSVKRSHNKTIKPTTNMKSYFISNFSDGK